MRLSHFLFSCSFKNGFGGSEMGRMLGSSIVYSVFCGFVFSFFILFFGVVFTLFDRKETCLFIVQWTSRNSLQHIHTCTIASRTNRNAVLKNPKRPTVYLYASIFLCLSLFPLYLIIPFPSVVHQSPTYIEECIPAVLSVVGSVLITYSVSAVAQ